MTTSKTESDDMVEAFDLGASDYVTKPIDFPVLLARIQSKLRLKKDAGSERDSSAETQGLLPGVRRGTLIADRYKIEEKIGAGGYARVYRARHLQLQRDVAIKILRDEVPKGQDTLALFQREAICASQIKHPIRARRSDA